MTDIKPVAYQAINKTDRTQAHNKSGHQQEQILLCPLIVYRQMPKISVYSLIHLFIGAPHGTGVMPARKYATSSKS